MFCCCLANNLVSLWMIRGSPGRRRSDLLCLDFSHMSLTQISSRRLMSGLLNLGGWLVGWLVSYLYSGLVQILVSERVVVTQTITAHTSCDGLGREVEKAIRRSMSSKKGSTNISASGLQQTITSVIVYLWHNSSLCALT